MNLLELYKNYLHALEYEHEYNNEYGDSNSLKIFEKMLMENNIKIITKDGQCEYEGKVKVKKL